MKEAIENTKAMKKYDWQDKKNIKFTKRVYRY